MLLLILSCCCYLIVIVNAKIECNTTSHCEKLLFSGSTCSIDGYCTNPFVKGCLRTMLGDKKENKYSSRLRTCNSHDDYNNKNNKNNSPMADDVCSISPLNYNEIRISPNNWESAMFYSWIIQILLSELVDVPVSIETGGGGGILNFYDEENSFAYPTQANNFDALYKSNSIPKGDCRLATSKPCAHVMPEVWQGKREVKEQQIERDGNGMVGHVGWYVPNWLIEEEPSLASHYGLSGNENRKKLSELFKRPITWKDYCNEISTNNCTTTNKATGTVDDSQGWSDENDTKSDDDSDEIIIAYRPPKDDDEGNKYYVSGLYNGYFKATEKNNCSSSSPNSCTGAIIDYPCGWSAYTDSQLYWNNISLESESYSYSDILQIMKASNATRSPAMFVWWYPDPSIDQYDLFNIILPTSTRECLNNRPDIGSGSRCNLTVEQKRGSKLGSCGYNTHSFEKIYSSNLRMDSVADGISQALHSPAYPMLRNIRISDIDISEILINWANRGIDKWNYDPRHAVCEWVANNIDSMVNLTKFIPANYPREIQPHHQYNEHGVLLYFAFVIASLVIIAILTTTFLTCQQRQTKIIRYAQVHFLYMYLMGYLFVCVGAVLLTIEPTNGVCMSRLWLILIGYTLTLIPLLVRIAAINRLMSNAKKMKRVTISQRKLYGTVAIFVLLVVIYLIIWTVVDPSKPHKELTLRSETDNIIDIEIKCQSSSGLLWLSIAYVWVGILILCSALLAFQSRNVRQEFNESRTVGNMAYMHFLFYSFMVIVYSVPSDTINSVIRDGTMSLLLSFDSIVCLLVYFGPKFYILLYKRDTNASTRRLSDATGGYSTESTSVAEANTVQHLNNGENNNNNDVVMSVANHNTDNDAFDSIKKEVTFGEIVNERNKEEHDDDDDSKESDDASTIPRSSNNMRNNNNSDAPFFG